MELLSLPASKLENVGRAKVRRSLGSLHVKVVCNTRIALNSYLTFD